MGIRPAMRIALVANAASGSGTEVDSVERALARGGATVRTFLPDDLPEQVEEERVVAASGDGMLGIAAALAARSRVPLGVIPVGTANDFARHMQLPADLDEAAALAADPRARLRPIDLAWIGDVPFLNAASAGLSVGAARAATPLKPVLGPFAYAVGGVSSAARGKPLDVHIESDGETCFSGRAWQLTVAGTGAFGAGSEIAVADPRDGELDIAVMEAGSRLRLARHAAGLRSGKLTELPGVTHTRGCEITVEGPDEWNVDGEMRAISPARFRIEPRALEVVAGA